jgi:hypothetical protein
MTATDTQETNTKQLLVMIPEDAHRAFRSRAVALGLTNSEAATQAFRAWLAGSVQDQQPEKN